MNQTKKITSFALVSAMCLTLFSGCSGAAQTTAAGSTAAAASTAAASTAGDKAPISIGYSNMSLKEDFFITVSNGMKAAAAKKSIPFSESIADRDATKMKQNIEALVTKGANVIVDFNVLPEAGSAIAASLTQEKIPMISVDCVYEGAYFFGVDNYGAGTKLGEYAVKASQAKFGGTLDYVVSVYDSSSGLEVKKRCDGVVDQAKKAFNLKASQVVELDCMADDIKTGAMVKDWLGSHPDAKKVIFVGQNDDRGYAINKVIESSNRVDDCILVSHNADPSSVENLQKHSKDKKTAWVATASYNSHLYGEQVIDMASKIYKGETVEKKVFAKTTIVGLDNIDQYVTDRDKVIASMK